MRGTDYLGRRFFRDKGSSKIAPHARTHALRHARAHFRRFFTTERRARERSEKESSIFQTASTGSSLIPLFMVFEQDDRVTHSRSLSPCTRLKIELINPRDVSLRPAEGPVHSSSRVTCVYTRRKRNRLDLAAPYSARSRNTDGRQCEIRLFISRCCA